ncbi:PorP/SprF family type IX secretion system membrane protein [Flagellimonas algicola]|uniref:Type IX secretion system membrane protein PorP/SprF n=1 Tax=Flagellimonas algicola TaxID=2583815 RepID=A0ABY2WIZ6_9FLAO|nr:PorP/SprF family type IX secretion system membrane protein [Allomuricauda algicola]TMU54809.1 type IX secretion system membrane protein PorP/SprF [Allomuricauda algicola]
MRKLYFILIFIFLPAISFSQEGIVLSNSLQFNRFLINPTFSIVREDKSYINLFYRNQSAPFDDNNRVYFLSYSSRVSDRSGVGISLFANKEGLFNNLGAQTNFSYGIHLSPKSDLTFGANISYYQSSIIQNRVNSIDGAPQMDTLEDGSLVLFQPGFNFSYGNFDFGAYAENLFDYNLRTSESITKFNEKTYSGHLQYTHQFKNNGGILEQGRLMSLTRVRKTGEKNITLGGNLVLDVPKLGWIQAGYDDFYGASAGLGFNLNKNLSIGYTVEKGLSRNFENFGLSHEISLAYVFSPNFTEDRVLLDNEEDLVGEFIEENKLSAKTSEGNTRERLKFEIGFINYIIANQDLIDSRLYREIVEEVGHEIQRLSNQLNQNITQDTLENVNLEGNQYVRYFYIEKDVPAKEKNEISLDEEDSFEGVPLQPKQLKVRADLNNTGLEQVEGFKSTSIKNEMESYYESKLIDFIELFCHDKGCKNQLLIDTDANEILFKQVKGLVSREENVWESVQILYNLIFVGGGNDWGILHIYISIDGKYVNLRPGGTASKVYIEENGRDFETSSYKIHLKEFGQNILEDFEIYLIQKKLGLR